MTYLLGAFATWLVAPSEPATVDELVDSMVGVTGDDPGATRDRIVDAVGELTGMGLLGRDEAQPPIEPFALEVKAPADGWVVGASHRLLDQVLAVCGPDPELVGAVDNLLGGGGRASPTLFVALDRAEDGGIDVVAQSLWRFGDLGHLLWQFPGIVNDIVTHLDSMAILHAGAVRLPSGRVVVVLGPMNSGKSTLVAALVRGGCDYLGDESIGIGAQGEIWPYPKPLTLDANSQELIGLDPIGEPFTAANHRSADELRRDVVRLDGPVGAAHLVVNTTYRPGAVRTARHLEPHEAIETLITNTLNLQRAGSDGLAALARLAETVPVVSIAHGDSLHLASHIIACDAVPGDVEAAFEGTGDSSDLWIAGAGMGLSEGTP